MEMNLLASTKTYCRNFVKACCINKTGRTIVFLLWCFISFTVLKRVDWNDDVLYQQLRIETSDTVDISDIVTIDPLIARIIASRGFDEREMCPTYNLAMVVWSPAEAREAGFMLKTLFFHRTSALHLHVIVTDDLTEKIMTTLMNTWELTLITFDIYKVSGIHHSQRRLLKYKLSTYLPTHLEEVMYVSNHVRFVSDIGELWSTIERGWQPEHVLAVESLSACNSTDLVECFVNAAIVFVDLRRFGKTCMGSKILDSKPPSNVLKCLLAHQHLLYMIPCEWTVRVTSELHTLSTCNTTNAIKGLIWRNLGDSFSSSPFIEKYREHVLSVLSNEPLVHELLNCRNTSHEITTGIKYEHTCDKFKYIAHLKRRTHLFYMGDTPDSMASTGDNDVSLMTMLTVDRWNVLERMMSRWKGPASVVFYVTDYEATTLEKLVQDSPVLSKRKRICYHVVYRRQKYNPINYLRNVAINNSATPYLIFVDVDLIPNPNLYDSLKIKIKEKLERNDNHTVFLVPAFQSFLPLDTNLPRNKSQLSWFLQQEIIVGYRMKASWTEGHRPTNFDHWVKATKPYRVAYERHFEPYVVVPSTMEDRYNEDLLERMQDKIAYTYMLSVFGASLKVLNEDFVVHIPHPVSQGTKQFNSDPDFERCGKQFVHDYYRELHRRKMADIRINAMQRQ